MFKSTKKRNTVYILIFFMLVSLVASIGIAAKRNDVESNYKNVELIFDFVELGHAKETLGIDIEDYLMRMKEAGLVSVTLEEDTLFDLESNSDVLLVTSSDVLEFELLGSKKLESFVAGASINVDSIKSITEVLRSGRFGTYVISMKKSVSDRLERVLPLRMSSFSTFEIIRKDDCLVAYIPYTMQNAELINIGFSSEKMDLINRTGLNICPRPSNCSGLNEVWLEYIMSSIEGMNNVSNIVFKGQDVMGYPINMQMVADRIVASEKLNYVDVEFGSQLGASTMTRLVKNHLVRLHTITREELNKGMNEQVAMDRYIRAVVERNMRLIYLRPFLPNNYVTALSLEKDIEFVEKLSVNLENLGYELSPSDRMEDVSISAADIALLVLGIFAAFMMLLVMFNLDLKPVLALILTGIIGILTYLALMIAPSLKNTIVLFVSLGAACVFPSLSVVFAIHPIQKNETELSKVMPKKFVNIFKMASFRYLVCAFIALGGCFILAGTMTTNSYMMHVSQFRGVKLMYLVPIVVGVFAFWLFYIKKAKASFVKSIVELFVEPIRIWHVALVAVFGALGIILLVRTGNATSGLVVAPSSLETSFRAFLEKAFAIRPRTKEFLLGHPALISLGFAVCVDSAPLVFLFAMGSVIGQVSIVNTFAHLHTPVAVSLTRALLGLGLGYIVGVVALFVVYGIYSAIKKKLVRNLA